MSCFLVCWEEKKWSNFNACVCTWSPSKALLSIPEDKIMTSLNDEGKHNHDKDMKCQM